MKLPFELSDLGRHCGDLLVEVGNFGPTVSLCDLQIAGEGFDSLLGLAVSKLQHSILLL